jgi:hypothetical protein
MRAKEFIPAQKPIKEHVSVNTSPFRDSFQTNPPAKKRRAKKKIEDLFNR